VVPSTCDWQLTLPPGTLGWLQRWIGARPRITRPPNWPIELSVAVPSMFWRLVKTIGLFCVPSAKICEPAVDDQEIEAAEPKITDAGSMVSWPDWAPGEGLAGSPPGRCRPGPGPAKGVDRAGQVLDQALAGDGAGNLAIARVGDDAAVCSAARARGGGRVCRRRRRGRRRRGRRVAGAAIAEAAFTGRSDVAWPTGRKRKRGGGEEKKIARPDHEAPFSERTAMRRSFDSRFASFDS
jgi:hypothetical protein